MTDCNTDWRDDRADAALKGWVERKLGCPVISVELDDEQIEDAIDDAREYWMSWIGRVRTVDLTTTTAREYAAELLGSDVDSVIDVYPSVERHGWSDMYGWAGVKWNPYQYSYNGRQGYSGYAQYMMYRDDLVKLLSADFDWEWDRSRRVLILSPENDDIGTVKVVYLSRCFDYGYLTTYEWKIFKDYVLSQAMKNLATIRMKFPEKPSATGTFSMDGESMYANAEAMEMRVEEKMAKLQRPVPIIMD